LRQSRWLRTPQRQPKARVPPGPQPRFPLAALVRDLAEAQSRFCESRARTRLPHLFRCICFLFRLSWDTLCPRAGHRRARQKPGVDLVVIDATRAALAGDGAALDEIPQMSGHGALGQPSERGELPHARPASPSAVGERHKALHRPSETRLQRAVDVESDGDKGKHGASGCSAPARKRLILGALCRCTPKGLAKIRGFKEARSRQTYRAFGQPDYADPPFPGGFLLYGFGVAASRKWSRARSGFRAATGIVEIVSPTRRFGFIAGGATSRASQSALACPLAAVGCAARPRAAGDEILHEAGLESDTSPSRKSLGFCRINLIVLEKPPLGMLQWSDRSQTLTRRVRRWNTIICARWTLGWHQ
jgi:hypothetical protein